MACAELSGGQRACFDYSFPVTCMTDDDCPMSPTGKHGECLDELEQVTSDDSVYHRCYFPIYKTDNKTSCWVGPECDPDPGTNEPSEPCPPGKTCENGFCK
jgi:hypothetical protein